MYKIRKTLGFKRELEASGQDKSMFNANLLFFYVRVGSVQNGRMSV
jgi:hypothetical protein